MLIGDIVTSKYYTALVLPKLLVEFAVLDVTQLRDDQSVQFAPTVALARKAATVS